jgi:hypothetical protein
MKEKITRETLDRDFARLEKIGEVFRSYGKKGADVSLIEVEKLLGDKFFGKDAYKELLGIDLDVGPLKGLTREYLESLCPVKNDNKTKIFESNVALIWVPETINGVPATVNSLATILNDKAKEQGKDPAVWEASWALHDGKNEPAYSKSVQGHFALVWLQEAPNTRASGMTFEKQDKIFEAFQKEHNKNGIIYDTAEAFSTFLGLTLTYLKTGVRNPADFNWLCCKEELNSIKRADGVSGRAAFGSSLARGLKLHYWRDDLVYYITGRAVSRKLRSPELVEG